MSSGAFKSAMVKQLVGLGFDRELAERQVSQQIAGEKLESASDSPRIHAGADVQTCAVIAFPLELVLPWSCLVSDNLKYSPASRGAPPRPVIILTERYRAAKEKIKTLVRPKVVGRAPASIPLRLEARVWVPDNHPRRHDVANFAKCTHDALEKLVYTTDHWLYDTRWIRAGVDVDHPRAEITITPLHEDIDARDH